MIPSQVEMVAKFSGKPFALIGINSDSQSRSALKERFAKEKVSWAQFIEGQDRAISKSWNVMAYPTLYILDHEGVIRHRDLHGPEEVTKAVEELLAKVPSGKS
ncbi:MAG: TlpA family protein disulfide reductase [Phycisphaerales bacterium]|nr:TlpA family protein disulfide reductase [Phycisphaerales bacterium]